MLEILYRIYEVSEQKDDDRVGMGYGMFSLSKANSREIAMDCLICETREQFKEIMRNIYGKDLRFAYSRKYSIGTIYCIIIGEHCWNTDRYFNKVEYICDFCGNKTTTYYKPIKIDNHELIHIFYNLPNYDKKQFCSESCKSNFLASERAKIRPNENTEFFIQRDMFTKCCAGYIYKITKKSTGEFYIGQTIYAPIFRWGQHLKTDRFDIKDILDYTFETIEIVPLGQNIIEREKYWIQKYYKENPTKSLNIMQTANLEQITIFDIKE